MRLGVSPSAAGVVEKVNRLLMIPEASLSADSAALRPGGHRLFPVLVADERDQASLSSRASALVERAARAMSAPASAAAACTDGLRPT